jgi:hypothetical protein
LESYFDALMNGDVVALAALSTDDEGLTGAQENHTRSDLSWPAAIQTTMWCWSSYVDHTDVEHLDAGLAVSAEVGLSVE